MRRLDKDLKRDSRAYFKLLGAFITKQRKAIGMTQAELARTIGVSQQAVFAYELGNRRVSIVIAIRIARTFKISVEELVTLARPKTRGPIPRLSPKAVRHAERIQMLPKTQKQFLIRIIDVLEWGNVPLAKQRLLLDKVHQQQT